MMTTSRNTTRLIGTAQVFSTDDLKPRPKRKRGYGRSKYWDEPWGSWTPLDEKATHEGRAAQRVRGFKLRLPSQIPDDEGERR